MQATVIDHDELSVQQKDKESVAAGTLADTTPCPTRLNLKQ